MAKTIANLDRCADQPRLPGTYINSSLDSTMSAMSSMSPTDQYGHKSLGYASEEPSDGGKSPLQMSLGFLKNLTEKKPARGMPRRLHPSIGAQS